MFQKCLPANLTDAQGALLIQSLNYQELSNKTKGKKSD
jgi:hypothetical protein